MPLYAFQLVNVATGEVVAHFDVPLPVAERDRIALRRAELPESLAIAGSAEHPDNNATMRVLHRAECRMGSTSEFQKKIGFSPETYKRAWANHKCSE